MPSGINNKTGKSNCELPQCVSAKVKAHKGKKAPTNKIEGIIDLLLPVLNSNVDFIGSDTSLSESLNMKAPVINVADVSIALLNLDRDAVMKRLEEDNYESAMTMIIYRLNPYLPANLKYKDYRAMSSINCRDELKDKIREFIFVVINYCMKLEDKLTIRYYMNPKMTNMLEMLKRRYKTNWSDNSGKSIEVKHTDEETDKTIEIIISGV